MRSQYEARRGKVVFVELSVSPTMAQAWERSELGDKEKWSDRELVSFGEEDLAVEETERALLLLRREMPGGGGPATSARRSPYIV